VCDEFRIAVDHPRADSLAPRPVIWIPAMISLRQPRNRERALNIAPF
jgi:hypothetical protein